jgi:hypothetical protein
MASFKDGDNSTDPRRCTAHSRQTRKRCKNASIPGGRVCRSPRRRGPASADLPSVPDRSQQQRIYECTPERQDCGHVRLAEPSVRLHQHGHPRVVAPTGVVRHPADVHHRVHGLVGHLGHPLVMRLVELPVALRALFALRWKLGELFGKTSNEPHAQRRAPARPRVRTLRTSRL